MATNSFIGNAVIIVNKDPLEGDVHNRFKAREGSEKDYDQLVNAFIGHLGFNLINTRSDLNLSKKQWKCKKSKCKICISCLIKNADHKGAKNFVFAITSHNGVDISGKMGIMLSDGAVIAIDSIIHMLSDETIPDLKDATKIVLVQTCRGSSLGDWHTVEVSNHGSTGNTDVPSTSTPPSPVSDDGSTGNMDATFTTTLSQISDGVSINKMDGPSTSTPSQISDCGPINKTDGPSNSTHCQVSDDGSTGNADGPSTNTHGQVTDDGSIEKKNVPSARTPILREEHDAEEGGADEECEDSEESDTNDNSSDSNYDSNNDNNSDSDSDNDSDSDDPDTESYPHGVTSEKLPNGFLVIYPTTPGHKSHRSKKGGSWLTSTLSDEFDSHFKKNGEMNFLQTLTRITGTIARRKEKVCHKKYKEVREATTGKGKRSKRGKGTAVRVKSVEWVKERDENGALIVDHERSGFKSAVCIQHTLTKPIVFTRKTRDSVAKPKPVKSSVSVPTPNY